MTHDTQRGTRYWGTTTPPKTRAEFFNAVTTPAPSGDGTVATIRMYGPIDSWGGWWGISTKEVGQVLDALPDTVTQIVLRINSPGGEVFEGISILNMLRAHKATFTAVVDGLAASAASVIAAGADKTAMSPGTSMMIHSPSTFEWGNASDLRKTADTLDSIERSLIEIYAGKAGINDWARLLADETWFTAEEAVKVGLADTVAVIPDAGETATVGEEETVIVIPDDDGDVEDLATLRFAARMLRSQKLPDSSEPGDPNQKEKLNMSDTIKAGLRERLGVTDADASDETLLAALDETLAEQSETPTASAVIAPEGAVLMDAGALKELRDQALLGAQARQAQIHDRREQIIKDALKDGRITSESRDRWRAQLDVDETGITDLLAGFPKNSATPVTEIGHADTVTSSEDALYAAAGWGATETEA